MKTCSPSGHPRCKFVKFSITSLAHQWILCSEWVPSKWESKQLIKATQSSIRFENLLMMDLFLTNMQLSLHETLIVWPDYCDVFISSLDSHSDGTHSLQRIHGWASDVIQNFSKSVQMKKQTHLHHGWSEDKYILSKFSFLSELFL